MSYFTQYEHQYNYNCKKIFFFNNKYGLIFQDFQRGHNCTFTQNCLCMKPEREQHKNMNVSVAPSFLLINSFRKAAAGLLCKV